MKKLLSLVLVLMIALTLNLQAFAFSDLGNHWAEKNIEKLVSLGAINGYEDNTFRPDDTITRAEFTKILLAALGVNPGNATQGNWYDTYTAEAVKKGLIIPGEFISMEGQIIRGEIARMIMRAIKSEALPENKADYTKQITDYNTTPTDYQEYILNAYVLGIITGYEDGTIQYYNKATRAEAATMVVRMLDPDKRADVILKAVKPQSNFIEPIITAHYNEYGSIFSVVIDNIADYSDDYSVKIECLSHPELNIAEMPNINGGYDKYDNRRWIKASALKAAKSKSLFDLMYGYWENGLHYDMKKGVNVKFKITVKNSQTEKSYIKAFVTDWID